MDIPALRLSVAAGRAAVARSDTESFEIRFRPGIGSRGCRGEGAWPKGITLISGRNPRLSPARLESERKGVLDHHSNL